MIKNILTLFVLLFVVATARAQFNKGCIIIGGTAGYNSQKVEGEDAGSIFNLSPGFGYFVSSKFAIGAAIAYQSISFSGESESTYQISPFGRYYFSATPKSAFFGQAGLSLVKFGENADGTGFLAGLGTDIFLNESIALEGVLAYQQANVEDLKWSNFGVNFGIQAFLHRNND